MPGTVPRDEGALGAELPARAAIVASVAKSDASTAVARLAASRARLRGAMFEIAHPPKHPSGFSNITDALLGRLRALPGAAIVLESVQSWWEQHPLRTVGVMAEEATKSFVVPAARRNPFTLIGVAAVAGAVLTLTRPWRWLIRPALLAGLVPQIIAHALKRMPASSWLEMLGKFSGTPRKKGQAPKRTHPAQTPPM